MLCTNWIISIDHKVPISTQFWLAFRRARSERDSLPSLSLNRRSPVMNYFLLSSFCFVEVLIMWSERFILYVQVFLPLHHPMCSISRWVSYIRCLGNPASAAAVEFKLGSFCLAQTWHMCRLPNEEGGKEEERKRIEFTTKIASPPPRPNRSSRVWSRVFVTLCKVSVGFIDILLHFTLSLGYFCVTSQKNASGAIFEWRHDCY